MDRSASAPNQCGSRVSGSRGGSCGCGLWLFEVCNQIMLDSAQVLEHRLPSGLRITRFNGADDTFVLLKLGAVHRVARTPARWRLGEDAPVIGQSEEQIATPFE